MSISNKKGYSIYTLLAVMAVVLLSSLLGCSFSCSSQSSQSNVKSFDWAACGPAMKVIKGPTKHMELESSIAVRHGWEPFWLDKSYRELWMVRGLDVACVPSKGEQQQ